MEHIDLKKQRIKKSNKRGNCYIQNNFAIACICLNFAVIIVGAVRNIILL